MGGVRVFRGVWGAFGVARSWGVRGLGLSGLALASVSLGTAPLA